MRGEGRTVFLVVLDGVADRPARELDGRTPLEAATTPNLDRLAAAGASGIVDVRAPGVPMSSDRAHTILFGYDLGAVPARGVLEARGFGVPVPEAGVAASASFARVAAENGGWRLTDRKIRDARDACEPAADSVAEFEAPDSVTVRFSYTWKNRGIVTLAPDDEEPLSPAVTDVDPFEAGLPVVRPEPLEGCDRLDAATRTADALAAYTRWSASRLDETPVDVVLSKWAAAPASPDSFVDRHGMSGVSLTRKPVLQGLGETLGLDVERPPDGYQERASAVRAALEEFDFVHAHYPEPDEVSHADPPAENRLEIESIDASLDPIVDRVLADPDLVCCVTADHTTPSRGNVVHSGEPVPAVVTGQTVRTDDVDAFGERPAASGGLGRFEGRHLLRILRAAADRVLLDGLRRTPAVPDHPTTDLEPLGRDE
jgi:2,3-bisphosphoglycerate-independent phosphoglycerate mutase